MSQHDMVVDNAVGAAIRGDVNAALSALVSLSSGATAPATTYAYQLWADTSSDILKQRNAANDGWISLLTLSTGKPIGLVVNTDVQAYSAVLAAIVTAGAAVLPGKNTIWLPAAALKPRTTNGPASNTIETTTNKIMVQSLDYDPATNQYAQIQIRMPKSWNEGTISAQFLWSNASGTGNVVWGIQGVAISDDDVLDAAFGTAGTVTDAVTAAGDVMQTAETGAVTIAGTPAAGDLVVFQIYREATNGSDTLAVNARLHGVALFYTTDASNDA